MIHQIDNSQLPFRGLGAGLGRFALALGAAWALYGAVPSQALALDTSWKEACTFKSAPQNYGDAERERVCMVQNYCQQMADAQGSAFTGNGCIMVQPSIAAAPQPGPRSAYTKR